MAAVLMTGAEKRKKKARAKKSSGGSGSRPDENLL